MRFVLVIVAGLAASACSTWNRNVSGDWDCPADAGLGCVSIAEADRYRGKSEAASQVGSGYKVPAGMENTAPIAETAAAPQDSTVTLPPFLKKEFWQKLGFGRPAETSAAPSAAPAAENTASAQAVAPAQAAAEANGASTATTAPVAVAPVAQPVSILPASSPALVASNNAIELVPSPAAERRTNAFQVAPTDGHGNRVTWTEKVRTSERIGRAWFFPYVDASGNLHDGSYVFFVLTKSTWNLE